MRTGSLVPPSHTGPLLLHRCHQRDHQGSFQMQRVGAPGLSDINPLAAVLSRGLRDPTGARKCGQWRATLWEPRVVAFFPNRYKMISIF